MHSVDSASTGNVCAQTRNIKTQQIQGKIESFNWAWVEQIELVQVSKRQLDSYGSPQAAAIDSYGSPQAAPQTTSCDLQVIVSWLMS